MTAQKLIEILSTLPPQTEVLSFYDFQELEINTVYQRADGAAVISYDEGNSQDPGYKPLC